jgi:hypothetical protein
MKKIFTIAAAALSATLLSAPASAGIIDFANFAAGNEQGVVSGTSLNIDGVNMTFSAGDVYDDGIYNPYFDDIANGKPAGLGVCRVLDGSQQCADSGDDSIDGDLGISEYVAIIFDDGPFSVLDISFRDGTHNLLNTDNVSLLNWAILDGVGGVISSGVDTFSNVLALATSGFFANVAGIGFGYIDTEFYIESISDVPLPGAIPLLISGLAGLGFASRKKKAA